VRLDVGAASAHSCAIGTRLRRTVARSMTGASSRLARRPPIVLGRQHPVPARESRGQRRPPASTSQLGADLGVSAGALGNQGGQSLKTHINIVIALAHSSFTLNFNRQRPRHGFTYNGRLKTAANPQMELVFGWDLRCSDEWKFFGRCHPFAQAVINGLSRHAGFEAWFNGSN